MDNEGQNAPEVVILSGDAARSYHARSLELAAAVQSGALRDPVLGSILAADGRTWSGNAAGNFNRFGRLAPIRHYADPHLALHIGDAAKRYLGPRGIQALANIRRFAQPDLPELHIDSVLTQMSIAYLNSEFIADAVFPNVQVDKPSDLFQIFDSPKWRRDEGTDLVRGLSAQGVRVGWTVSTDSYRVERYTVETAVDDLQRRTADSPINVDQTGVNLVTDKLALRKEQMVRDAVFTAGNWTNAINAPVVWDNATSTPLVDAMTARIAVRQLIGLPVNTLVMGVQVLENLILHPSLLDRIKYSGTADRPAAVTVDMIAQLFQVDRVLVGAAVKNTAAETIPDTETLSFIWDKKVWFGHVPPTAARETPAAGYTFTMGRRLDRYREDRTTSDVIRAEEEWAVKVTAKGAGYLMSNVVT